ncbi:MAG: AlpA family transcriptional regulator [Oceanicaulis sp.]|nr:AlpA family transcriptional regulator [Oceanicaulis sp.]
MYASNRILRRREVEIRTGLSRSSIYASIAAGQFPAPLRLTARSVGWVEHEIDSWIEQRVQQRGCGGPSS